MTLVHRLFGIMGGSKEDYPIRNSSNRNWNYWYDLHFIVAFIVSRVTEPPPNHIQEMVEQIRIPRGAGKAQEH